MANQLPAAKRVKILHLLLEGNSMRSICRLEEVNWRTVDKLLRDAARASRRYHRRKIKDIDVNEVQCDELWSFCYAKQKNADTVATDDAGDVWTWVALEADSKLVLAYRIDDRTDRACRRFIKGLESRLSYDDGLRICTDGNASYVKAVNRYFGKKVTFLQLVKEHKARKLNLKYRQISGPHVTDKASTSFIERFNLTIRMSLRRYTRKTNGFSKTLDNHKNMVDLFVFYYNFVRVHETLGTTPEVNAGLARNPYSLDRLVRKMERIQQQDKLRYHLPVR